MNVEVHKILKKTQAFLRGLEATLDELVAKTISKGETLLNQEHEPPPEREPASTQPTEPGA
jgi:hypothetical protein